MPDTTPMPNATAPSNGTALFQASGNLAGSHFVVDSQNNTTLSRFGGIVQVPLGPYLFGMSTFRLYVDGRMVAAKTLPYSVVSRCFSAGGFCWVLP